VAGTSYRKQATANRGRARGVDAATHGGAWLIASWQEEKKELERRLEERQKLLSDQQKSTRSKLQGGMRATAEKAAPPISVADRIEQAADLEALTRTWNAAVHVKQDPVEAIKVPLAQLVEERLQSVLQRPGVRERLKKNAEVYIDEDRKISEWLAYASEAEKQSPAYPAIQALVSQMKPIQRDDLHIFLTNTVLDLFERRGLC
jgi:hypothetical protein